MTKSKIRLVFSVLWLCGIWGLRYATQANTLPQSWTADSLLSFTALILEEPEHTDTQTIIKRGRWIIRIRGYKELSPGTTYRFVGKVEPQVLLGKETRIVMVDPTIEIAQSVRLSPGDAILIKTARLREWAVAQLRQVIPDTESTLAAGILLGYSGSMPRTFREELASTGTMHTIAASGYNVTIVTQVVAGVATRVLPRRIVWILSLISILIYVLVAGGSASIVRASVMGSLTLIAVVLGRQALAKRMLIVTAIIMLLIDPLLIADVGFLLSVAATAGLLYLEPIIHQRLGKLVDKYFFSGYVAEYLYPTLAASTATLPIILLVFGRVSYISPVANMLVLPLVPVIMFLTAVYLICSWVPYLGSVLGWVLYVPLKIFVLIIHMLG